jgi:hypothetical protein
VRPRKRVRQQRHGAGLSLREGLRHDPQQNVRRYADRHNGLLFCLVARYVTLESQVGVWCLPILIHLSLPHTHIIKSDVDECALRIAKCSNNAQCVNTVGSYTCACNEGWAGDGLTCQGTQCCSPLSLHVKGVLAYFLRNASVYSPIRITACGKKCATLCGTFCTEY